MGFKQTYARQEDELIVLTATLQIFQDDEDLPMALDTGAKHTVIDLNALILLGVDVRNPLETTSVLTGKWRY